MLVNTLFQFSRYLIKLDSKFSEGVYEKRLLCDAMLAADSRLFLFILDLIS